MITGLFQVRLNFFLQLCPIPLDFQSVKWYICSKFSHIIVVWGLRLWQADRAPYIILVQGIFTCVSLEGENMHLIFHPVLLCGYSWTISKIPEQKNECNCLFISRFGLTPWLLCHDFFYFRLNRKVYSANTSEIARDRSWRNKYQTYTISHWCDDHY